ncbi:hypothetical protein CC78DRAFT_24734 [Lojkania enalia]|uniref:Uncharacterized protein n=1 Tax=Lojkania enalia TaxID=147567 RepID=A0A9P4K0Z2_9PLEO|nr:hypothetical protein CC78DRAFT_24734 [Didymosphaeria enalia]
MATNPAPNVWNQMNYVPPRGQCNFKQSIMSAKCPCLRFMLHPLKSASSYECDGCNHHASFHSMENKAEDEVRKRWELEAKAKEEEDRRVMARPRKRLREIGFADVNGDVRSSHVRLLETGILMPEEIEECELRSTSEVASSKGRSKRSGRTRQTATRGTKAKGKAIGMPEDDEDFIDMD